MKVTYWNTLTTNGIFNFTPIFMLCATEKTLGIGWLWFGFEITWQKQKNGKHYSGN
jgi:hypothetical protein